MDHDRTAPQDEPDHTGDAEEPDVATTNASARASSGQVKQRGSAYKADVEVIGDVVRRKRP